MKNIILLVAVMVVSACASMPTVKSVAGTYEIKRGENTFRMVLLENGVVEGYINGENEVLEGKWKLTKEGEIHASDSHGNILVCRINKDGSITRIASIDKDGERKEVPKDKQNTLKKIK